MLPELEKITFEDSLIVWYPLMFCGSLLARVFGYMNGESVSTRSLSKKNRKFENIVFYSWKTSHFLSSTTIYIILELYVSRWIHINFSGIRNSVVYRKKNLVQSQILILHSKYSVHYSRIVRLIEFENRLFANAISKMIIYLECHKNRKFEFSWIIKNSITHE